MRRIAMLAKNFYPQTSAEMYPYRIGSVASHFRKSPGSLLKPAHELDH